MLDGQRGRRTQKSRKAEQQNFLPLSSNQPIAEPLPGPSVGRHRSEAGRVVMPPQLDVLAVTLVEGQCQIRCVGARSKEVPSPTASHAGAHAGQQCQRGEQSRQQGIGRRGLTAILGRGN